MGSPGQRVVGSTARSGAGGIPAAGQNVVVVDEIEVDVDESAANVSRGAVAANAQHVRNTPAITMTAVPHPERFLAT
jgi:hypothetical protein